MQPQAHINETAEQYRDRLRYGGWANGIAIALCTTLAAVMVTTTLFVPAEPGGSYTLARFLLGGIWLVGACTVVAQFAYPPRTGRQLHESYCEKLRGLERPPSEGAGS
jgi:hypothetical protein